MVLRLGKKGPDYKKTGTEITGVAPLAEISDEFLSEEEIQKRRQAALEEELRLEEINQQNAAALKKEIKTEAETAPNLEEANKIYQKIAQKYEEPKTGFRWPWQK
ncbi:hypothetical protein HC823_02045 [Candidatus Gracilibacteria bacterium]|nr:hypothetical protein [Candidatus Gracilibacteria bacterium]